MAMKSNLSQLKDFLAHISSNTGDLSNITAPPFVLGSKSATEIPASWASQQSIFLAQGKSEDPAKRALSVLKNYLVSLKAQTYTGRTEAEGLKKPLNAFLGELFLAKFDDNNTTTRLISEQVSHHPPVTACFMYNKDHGITAEGYVRQKVTFAPTSGVTIEELGHAITYIAEYDEHYLMTLPILRAKGVLTGAPYPELDGTCYITSTTGYTSKISFSGKSFFGSGTKNSVEAVLYKHDEPNKILFKIKGQWNGKLVIQDCTTNSEIETIDISTLKPSELKVAPLEEQDPWESRKAWGPTVEGIFKQDLPHISREKKKIEESQRAIRKAQAAGGDVDWPRLFFIQVEKDEIFEQLAKKVGEPFNFDMTDGIWKFIGIEAAEKISPPYHQGLAPTGQLLE